MQTYRWSKLWETYGTYMTYNITLYTYMCTTAKTRTIVWVLQRMMRLWNIFGNLWDFDVLFLTVNWKVILVIKRGKENLPFTLVIFPDRHLHLVWGCAILMFDYRYPEILTFGYGKYDKYVGKSSIPGDLLRWEYIYIYKSIYNYCKRIGVGWKQCEISKNDVNGLVIRWWYKRRICLKIAIKTILK